MSNDQEAYSETSLERIKEIISTLPAEDGWSGIQPLHLYQGFWYYPLYLENIILAQEYFKAEPSDVFVCSTPKSGTTWLKALTFSIVTRSHYDSSTSPLLYHLPHSVMPTLNQCFSNNQIAREPGLPLIASHAPYDSLPESIKDSECKIVYVCRDPKDAFVSLFYFIEKDRPKENETISLEEAFELYSDGRSNFGPFWDHILGYWKASMERPEKVLFLKYEEMMKDPNFHVKKLAQFMGYPISKEEEEQGLVEIIVKMCSFEFLSNLEVNKNGTRTRKVGSIQNSAFFRKGNVGDWENHLTSEMAGRIDTIIQQKLGGFGLTFNSTC